MLNTLVTINNLVKKFPNSNTPSLNAIKIEIFAGKIIGLVGPDGAGKTTLIRIIAGLLSPTSGQVTINYRNSKVDGYISYMPQKFGLYEDLTVIENLNLYADLHNVIGNERKNQFERLLNFTDLKKFQNRFAGALSGGMKQKLGLACCLIKKPTLLLLDEPSVGVDPISRRELWNMVKELTNNEIGIIWSTAYLDEAEKCDEVLLLNAGTMLFQGYPQELYKRVKNRTFQIQDITGTTARAILTAVLKNDQIVDGVIQGEKIRIITRQANIYPSAPELNTKTKFKVVKVEPKFEDVFVDILGGGPGGESLLAKNVESIPAYQGNVIVASKLTKTFGDFKAVDDISFAVKQGEIFGLLGPNGAGKSTTFKMMCGLLKSTSGTSEIMGCDWKISAKNAGSKLGYMAQKFSLYDNLSVVQNLNFFAGIYGLSWSDKQNKMEQMIQIFGLEEYLNKSASSLPFGFKQRLALSCAVMHNPPVLFLDEPTSGVDPITRREFWLHINGLVQKGVTIVVTTHFMDEAEYCDRIGLIFKGRLIALDSPDNLKKMVKSKVLIDPNLEDAFIELIKNEEEKFSV